MTKTMSPWKVELRKIVFSLLDKGKYSCVGASREFFKIEGVTPQYDNRRFIVAFRYKTHSINMAIFNQQIYRFHKEWESINNKKD